MDAEIEKLVAMLEEAETSLRKHGNSHWADWLKKDRSLIGSLDLYGIEHLLSAFGGMGSLNDQVLAEPSKDNPNKQAVSADNVRLQSLLSEIHFLATKLLSEEQRVQRGA